MPRRRSNVEAVVEAVGDVEVAVDDHVQERPQQKALVPGVLFAALHLEAVDHLLGCERRGV
jgi:hypothetical protein